MWRIPSINNIALNTINNQRFTEGRPNNEQLRSTGNHTNRTWTWKTGWQVINQTGKQIWIEWKCYENNTRRGEGMKDNQPIHGNRNCLTNNWIVQLLLTATRKSKTEEKKRK